MEGESMSDKIISQKYLDRIGKTYYQLTIVAYKYVFQPKKLCYVLRSVVKCACGHEMLQRPSPSSKSCRPCYEKFRKRKFKIKHGLINTPEYGCWRGAKGRCYNKKRKEYPNYGGRVNPGPITVCDRWLDKENGFLNFLQDMGEKPEPKQLYSIDRRDNDGNYTPENCFWGTRSQQILNRRANKLVCKICLFCNDSFDTRWTKKVFCTSYCRSKAFTYRSRQQPYPLVSRKKLEYNLSQRQK